MALTLFGSYEEELWYSRVKAEGHTPELTDYDEEGCNYVAQPYRCTKCGNSLHMGQPSRGDWPVNWCLLLRLMGVSDASCG